LAKKVYLYDTTLRDGTQSEEVNFTVNDKLRIARRLIDFGIDCVEGGWPGSNPRDIEFFDRLKTSNIQKDKISAFSSTRKAKFTCEKDTIIQALLKAETPIFTIFGKTSLLHVQHALGISPEENLEIISDTVSYLKRYADRVFFDAEHFFDGFAENADYACKAVEAAYNAGADAIVLCETNGGVMMEKLSLAVRRVREVLPQAVIGIHCHNDCGLAVANSICAIENGAEHLQGTINGLGERCGNANLCTLIPNLQLKYGYDCVGEKIKDLKALSMFVSELGNLTPALRDPFVGRSAFTHKAGVHVSAVVKKSATYEHIEPEVVGNTRRVLVSDLSGKSNLLYKAEALGLDIDKAQAGEVLERLKKMESIGYEYEGAEASFELIVLKAMGKIPTFFDLIGYRVIDDKRGQLDNPQSEATVMLAVNGETEHTAADGNGPVNALDNAVRKALVKFYPSLADMKLVDFKVRILNSNDGTAALTRVLMESSDERCRWSTVGVAANIIDASYQALVDAVQYKLYKAAVRGENSALPNALPKKPVSV
jgi:2-isopropylmalate synthase